MALREGTSLGLFFSVLFIFFAGNCYKVGGVRRFMSEDVGVENKGGVPSCLYCLGAGPMCKVMWRTFGARICADCCVCGVYVQCR